MIWNLFFLFDDVDYTTTQVLVRRCKFCYYVDFTKIYLKRVLHLDRCRLLTERYAELSLMCSRSLRSIWAHILLRLVRRSIKRLHVWDARQKLSCREGVMNVLSLINTIAVKFYRNQVLLSGVRHVLIECFWAGEIFVFFMAYRRLPFLLGI